MVKVMPGTNSSRFCGVHGEREPGGREVGAGRGAAVAASKTDARVFRIDDTKGCQCKGGHVTSIETVPLAKRWLLRGTIV